MAVSDATVVRRATPTTANVAAHDAAETPMPSGALDVVDSPLIPADRLLGGQAAVTAQAMLPANKRTLWNWIDSLLRALEIKADGTALRTFRRLFVDLYKHWQVSHAVHGAITGHDAIATAGTVTEAGGRHDTLSRVYFDARATHLLAEARAVMEHVRTVYPLTGAPYGSARVP